MSYEWFGHSTSAKQGLVIVGAPQSRLCARSDCATDQNDKQSIGRAYVYKYPSQTPIMVVRGSIEFEQLGYSCDLSLVDDQAKKVVIAVGSPSKDTRRENVVGAIDLGRAGVVQLFNLDVVARNVTLRATLKTDRAYSGFGARVKFYSPFGHSNEDLYISAHLRSDDVLLLGQVEDGMVYRFRGGSNLPSGNFTDDCGIDVYPCPAKKATTTFTLGERRSQFGYDFTFLKTPNKVSVNIAVSSIHATYGDGANIRLAGKLNIMNFNL